jgi:hypothetical protein
MDVLSTTRSFHGTFTLPSTAAFQPFTKDANGQLLVAGVVPQENGGALSLDADGTAKRIWLGTQKGGGNAATVYYGDHNRQNKPIPNTTDGPGVYEFNTLLSSYRFVGSTGDKVEFAIYW